MKLLISIPVHEAVECVADQLANIAKFAPQASVILHASKSSGQEFIDGVYKQADYERLSSSLRVWVNSSIETSPWTVWRCHVSNFRFAFSNGVPFTHFGMESSNSLFVRQGVEDYVFTHGYGIFLGSVVGSGWSHESAALADWEIQRFEHPRLSQIEGTFFSRGTFRRMVERMGQCSEQHWPQEEVWPATLYKGNVAARPWCLCGWHYPNYVPSAEIVREIVAGRHNGIYSVKRVPRDMTHWLRKMVHTL